MSNLSINRGLLITSADGARPRMYLEQQKLQDYFPQFRLVGSQGRVQGARGWLETNLSSRYDVRISLPPDYPHSMPAVHPDGWSTQGVHHVYSDGSLCLMKPTQWLSYFTLAYVVAKTALWLNKFEVWKQTRRWPGREQQHGALPTTGFFHNILRNL